MHQQQLHNRSQTAFLSAVLALLLVAAQTKAGVMQVFDVDAHNPKVERVTDLCPGPCSGANGHAAVYANKILFAGTDASNEEHLWALDSNNALTHVFSTNHLGSDDIKWLTPADGDLYYHAFNPHTGYELWKYNGTSAGLAMEFVDGEASASPIPLLDYNGDLLLFAKADTGDGLYKFRNGSAELVALGSSAHGAVIHQDDVWLGFNDTLFGSELWRYDGANFSLAQDLEPGPDSSNLRMLGSLNGELVYAFGEWNGRPIIKGVMELGTVGSNNAEIHQGHMYYGGELYGAGEYAVDELIRYDGAYQQVPVLEAGVVYLKSHKQSLYFSGSTDFIQNAGGTFRYRNGILDAVATGIPGVRLSIARNFLEFGNKLYFQASTTAHGYEWWSLSEGPRLSRVHMQLTPMWDNRYLWQLDMRATGAPLDLTYALYKIADTGDIAQLTSQRVYLDKHTAHTDIQKGGRGFSDKEQGIATLVVAFDSKTQRKLFLHVEVTGKDKSFDAKAAAKLEGDARAFGQRIEFKEVLGRR